MSLIKEAEKDDYPASIELVLSNKVDAPGLEFAQKQGIKTFALDHKMFGTDRLTHEWFMHTELKLHNIEIICLAGYMRILTPNFVGLWKNKMINTHPSLLPAFTGLRTHERVLESGAKYHGCTVHIVTNELDLGPIIDQAIVPVLPTDTAETLNTKVLKQEHKIYPRALKTFIESMES
jgi:phosphoribosylglycinamide formyltransferase-1